MEKHEHMVYQNKIKNQAKVEKAIKAIHKLLREEQQVVVCTLVKCTGLSRAFFYNNEIVHNELIKAQSLQEGKAFVAPQRVVINKAMDKEITFLKQKLAEKEEEISNLKTEAGNNSVFNILSFTTKSRKECRATTKANNPYSPQNS